MRTSTKLITLTAVTALLLSCGNDAVAPVAMPLPTMAAAGSGAPIATCTIPADCHDLTTSFFQYPACCSPNEACGYAVSFDEAFLDVYPQARELLANVAADDPEGKCVPERYVFPTRPGTYDHRVQVDGPEEADILVAAQCESRGLLAFTLPGCCMPDDRCGISTDEVALQLGLLLGGEEAPFSKPECVTADELNTQLAASSLHAFARIPATSSAPCDHRALAEAFPRFRRATPP
jgi:hypothetical protein